MNQWAHQANSTTEALALALADLRFLGDIWKMYSSRTPKDARSLSQFRNPLATGEIVPNLQVKGVTLAAAHGVKGLEYDIVFIMGLVEGCFPDYRAINEGGSALNEEKNDAFVAVTRSKRLFFLSWLQNKLMPWDQVNRAAQRKSRFLTEIERSATGGINMDRAAYAAEASPSYPRNPRPSAP